MPELTINGKKWAASHQASVNAILDPRTADARKVLARGSSFFNKDKWTCRVLQTKLCESVSYGNEFGYDMVVDALWSANATHVSDPHIVVATNPDRIPLWLARAGIGGDYHEAWHTEYSCRRDLTIEDVWGPLSERWTLLADWRPYIGAVLTWGNLIEDIRIERCGCAKYPGAPDKMADLQDLILKMESEGREASEHRGIDPHNDLSVVMGAFRDLGLGYDTDRQNEALAGYRERSPAGWSLVTEGPLKPLLDRAIALTPEDDLGHWWLAMEIVALLVALGHNTPSAPPPPSNGGGEGEPGPPGPPSEGEGEGGSGKAPKFPVFKVGDRARAKVGPHAGEIVEVTFAGLPDADGRQGLKFAVVVEDD